MMPKQAPISCRLMACRRIIRDEKLYLNEILLEKKYTSSPACINWLKLQERFVSIINHFGVAARYWSQQCPSAPTLWEGVALILSYTSRLSGPTTYSCGLIKLFCTEVGDATTTSFWHYSHRHWALRRSLELVGTRRLVVSSEGILLPRYEATVQALCAVRAKSP